MEKEKLRDDFLVNLLKSSQTEKPGFDFTAKVMSNIRQLEAEKAKSPLFTPGNILLISGGIIAILLIYFAVAPFLDDLSFFNKGIEPERFNRYFDLIMSSFQGFVKMIEFLKGSSITLIVLFVIPSLLILDRVLRRFSSRTYLFLF